MVELELKWRTAAKGLGIRAFTAKLSGFGAAAVLIMVKQPAARGSKLDFAARYDT
jgi:hypothetical protein